MEMSPITGDLPEMDARRDRPGHDVVARRVLAVEHIWQHDYVLALLGLRHPRVGPRRAEPGIDLKDWPHLSVILVKQSPKFRSISNSKYLDAC